MSFENNTMCGYWEDVLFLDYTRRMQFCASVQHLNPLINN